MLISGGQLQNHWFDPHLDSKSLQSNRTSPQRNRYSLCIAYGAKLRLVILNSHAPFFQYSVLGLIYFIFRDCPSNCIVFFVLFCFVFFFMFCFVLLFVLYAAQGPNLWFQIWWPGPDSRNDPLAIGSDTILWSWSADRIPQTPITIGSSDRENTKPNSLLPIKSRHKSFTGKFRIEITWSWLNEKRQTD